MVNYCSFINRLGRFFGIPKNTGFFEEPVFLVLPNTKYRKTGKRRKIKVKTYHALVL